MSIYIWPIDCLRTLVVAVLVWQKAPAVVAGGAPTQVTPSPLLELER